jgi:hypothetical protein
MVFQPKIRLEGCYSTIELHPRQFSAPTRKARSARLRSYKQMALPVKAGAALRFCARRAKIAHQFWVRKRDDSRRDRRNGPAGRRQRRGTEATYENKFLWPAAARETIAYRFPSILFSYSKKIIDDFREILRELTI